MARGCDLVAVARRLIAAIEVPRFARQWLNAKGCGRARRGGVR